MKEYARAAGVFFLMGFFLATPEAGWAQEPSVMPLKLPVDETVRSLAISALEHAPLRFVANGGKYAGEVAYYARSKGATVYCTDQGVIFGFADGQIRLTFSDHRRVRPEGRGLLPGVVNYFMGKEAGQWQAGIPTYQEVTYSEVYPGIDLVYEGSHRLLKYTYYVQPGSDPGQIQMRFDGVNGISVDTATRELVIQTRWGEMRDAPPVAYQEIGGVRKEVDVSFCLMDEGRIGFSVGAYDPDGLLVIDPVYSTYLGGGDLDEGHDIAVDGDGNVYVAGYTSSSDFPALNAYDSSYNGGSDAFVTKLSNSGALVYSTFLGGSGLEESRGIAADDAGNVYVTGYTSSSDFPALNAYDSSYNGGRDAFVTRLFSGVGVALDRVALALSTAFGAPGDTARVAMRLANPNEDIPVGGLQFDILSASSLSVHFAGLDDTTALPGFSMSASALGDTTRILIHSPSGAVIPPSDNAFLLTLRYALDPSADLGSTIALRLTNAVIGDSLGFALPDSLINGEIQVGIRGDLNLDGRVTVLDIIKLVRILIGKEATPDSGSVSFNLADMNADETIHISDVVFQVNTILHRPLTKPAPSHPVAATLGETLTLSDGSLAVPLFLDAVTFGGFQASFTFDPKALSVDPARPGGDPKHLLIDSHVSNGVLNVVVVHLTGEAVTDGPLLLIPVTPGDAPTGIRLGSITVVDRQAGVVPVTVTGGSRTVGAKESALPTVFALHSARPNPFNPSTRIAYDVPRPAQVRLIVYNLLGQEVIRLVDAVKASGRYEAVWNGRNAKGQPVASGVYVYRMTSGTGFSETKRMTLVK